MKAVPPTPPSRQAGITLVMGLLFLALLSLIALVTSGVSLQEGYMARNYQDRHNAFNAAEAGLRECESRLAAGTEANAWLDHPNLPQARCRSTALETGPGFGGNDSLAGGRPQTSSGVFRVEAEGDGNLPGTRVRLQSIFIPRT